MYQTKTPLNKVKNSDDIVSGLIARSFKQAVFLLKGTIFIPVTRRIKGYTIFVGKYVTGRWNRFGPHKVYIFLIRSRVDLAMSILGLGMQIPKIPASLFQQRATPTLTPTNRPKLLILPF